MHYITDVRYVSGYGLQLQFEDGPWHLVNLEQHLDGEMFEPLKDIARFATAHLNEDVDTVVWGNGADMSPDFLYEISMPLGAASLGRVAEPAAYQTRDDS
jgi:hypothetical protein